MCSELLCVRSHPVPEVGATVVESEFQVQQGVNVYLSFQRGKTIPSGRQARAMGAGLRGSKEGHARSRMRRSTRGEGFGVHHELENALRAMIVSVRNKVLDMLPHEARLGERLGVRKRLWRPIEENSTGG